MSRKTARPIKMWINGRIFTVPEPPKRLKQAQDCVMNEEELEHLDITQELNRYSAKIKLPKWYHPRLSKISDLSSTLAPDDTIVVENDDKASLAKALGRLHSTVTQLRLKSAPLQFTCIPCTHPTIQKSFLYLRSQLLSMQDEIPGLDASIFMSHLKLHVTIDVYSLFDEVERAEAVKALEEYRPTLEELLQRTGPMSLDIGTLDCMNSNLKNVNVLYANARFRDESPQVTLQAVVDGIAEHFYQRGLARKDPRSIKLHMTVLNSKYRKSCKGKWTRHGVDATKILERFKDFHFGQCSFDAVHLSHMSLRGSDGFYEPLAVMRLSTD
ncbi:hypothetical protein YQE_10862, partial [Dendroctonus ponderosae]